MATVGDPDASGQSVDVLVVDDEPQMADLIGTFLERTDEGLDVTTATSAREGLAAVEDGEYDCVISDYHMPQMDGLALLDEIDEQTGDVAQILYTSDDDASVMVAAREAGVDYIHKETSTEQYAAMATHIRHRVADRG